MPLVVPDLAPRPLSAAVRRWLSEDRTRQDITSRLAIPPRTAAHGLVVAQAKGVMSGIPPVLEIARQLGLHARPLLREGSRVRAGDAVLEVWGDARKLLASERTMLNVLMHLSGVATATARGVESVRRSGGRTLVAATRKTLPGLRDLEKAAVVHGGGDPHRRDLSSTVLVKNNHLALVPLRELLRCLRSQKARGVSVIVEARSVRDAMTAAREGADRLLLDNMSPQRVRALIRALQSAGLRDGVVVEVSGGIDPKSVRRYARTGADVASMGSLTHSAPALPYHLVVRPARRSKGRKASGSGPS
ncbi:MAG: carboxylating nicotinate-nucleotide diphosphorylase [Euryarchaeota archaeon]|nr:carboxylating nicotinate-nucleotide diphosphorylase [Euryarchaeota archaeon]